MQTNFGGNSGVQWNRGVGDSLRGNGPRERAFPFLEMREIIAKNTVGNGSAEGVMEASEEEGIESL